MIIELWYFVLSAVILLAAGGLAGFGWAMATYNSEHELEVAQINATLNNFEVPTGNEQGWPLNLQARVALAAQAYQKQRRLWSAEQKSGA